MSRYRQPYYGTDDDRILDQIDKCIGEWNSNYTNSALSSATIEIGRLRDVIDKLFIDISKKNNNYVPKYLSGKKDEENV